MIDHIVWDWNGTLLDDLDISVAAASLACQLVGGPQVDHAAYRRCFTRPVRQLYERLLARPATDQEWRLIVERYHGEYHRLLPGARLQHEAPQVLREVSERGLTQSVLSMGGHDELVEQVGRHGIDRFLLLVEGSPKHRRTDRKQGPLARHLAKVRVLRQVPLRSQQVLVIGDTVDDCTAAIAAGAVAVLIAGGSYHDGDVGRLGLAVAPSLRAAVELGLSAGSLRPSGPSSPAISPVSGAR